MRKKMLIFIWMLALFLFGCGTGDSISDQVNGGDTNSIYDESRTQMSIYVGANIKDYLNNFKIIEDGKKVEVTADMIKLDTTSPGIKEAEITYNGIIYLATVVVSNNPKDFILDSNDNTIVSEYTGSDIIIVIPRYINKNAVKTIGSYMFSRNENILKIFLPYIQKIEADAFFSCKNLNYAYAPLLKETELNAFSYCGKLLNVDMPKLEKIGGATFNHCIVLKNVDLSVANTIENGAFFECFALENISIPNVKKIGDNAFYKCQKLKSISLPNIEIIGSNSFNWCKELATVEIGDAVEIGDSAFGFCTGLKELRINGTKIPKLGEYLFSDGGTSKVWNITVSADLRSNYITSFQSTNGIFSSTKKPSLNGSTW